MVLVTSHRELIWQVWADFYIVYQPSSAETHVFNETTALILRILQEGSQSMEMARRQTEVALGLDEGGLSVEEFAFATMRLEELGLIERQDETSVAK